MPDLCDCQQGFCHQVLSHVLQRGQILISLIKMQINLKLFEMRFSGFFCCYSVSHCSNKPTIKIRLIISLSVGKRTKSAGDQIFFSPTVHVTEERIQWIQHPVKEWVIGIAPRQGAAYLVRVSAGTFRALYTADHCSEEWGDFKAMRRRKILKQGCQTQFLEGHSPAEFSSNPN